MINDFNGVGRLTSDPVLQVIKKGNKDSSVVNFDIAIQRIFKNKDGAYDADFIPTVVWNQLADICAKQLHKGDLIAVKGRMQSRRYQNSEKKWVYVIELVADEVNFGFGNHSSKAESDPEIDSDVPDLPDMD